MSNERVILLGVTGIERDKVVEQLSDYRDRVGKSSDFEYIDFESYLQEDIISYLESDELTQRRAWIHAWESVKSNHSFNSKDILLGLHGVLTRYAYGSRSPVVNDKLLTDFRPTAVITLIQDIYIHKYITAERAGRRTYIGKPSIPQLLQARRSSIFMGDLLANHSEINDFNPSSYVISTWHPAHVLDEVVYNRSKSSSVYLALPISEPRRLLSNGNPSIKNTFNDLLRRTYNHSQRTQSDTTFFSPLTIDEYPFKEQIESLSFGDDEEDKCVLEFNMSNRWDVRDFYDDDILLIDDRNIEDRMQFEVERYEAEYSPGLITSDVRYRDYKLVRQSDYVGILNPILPSTNKISDGVHNEIEHALLTNTKIHIYQKDSFDEDQRLEEQLRKKVGGSLGESPIGRRVIVYNEFEDWLESFE